MKLEHFKSKQYHIPGRYKVPKIVSNHFLVIFIECFAPTGATSRPFGPCGRLKKMYSDKKIKIAGVVGWVSLPQVEQGCLVITKVRAAVGTRKGGWSGGREDDRGLP